MSAERKQRVLLIYRRMIPSIRLCGHCQLESLAARGILEYRAVQELRLSADDLAWADIALLGRTDSRYEDKLARRLRIAGKRLIYIIDDDLLNIPSYISSARYYGQPRIQLNIRDMIEMSDAILSPSPILLGKYAVDGRAAIQIEEPALDPVPFVPHDPDRAAVIGFAGSIDRSGDLEQMLSTVLLRIHRAYGDRVRFEFFGTIPSFASALGARCIPYCDSYDDYRRTLNERAWDIGLAPLPGSDFNACKHYNKFSEYAAAGIVGVYSDRLPYTRIPDRERLGFFCKDDPEDWYARIAGLLDDRAGREACRQRCSAFAAEALNVDMIADELWQALKGFGPAPASRPIGPARLLLWKALNIADRGLDVLKRNGLKTPAVAFKKLLGRLKG